MPSGAGLFESLPDSTLLTVLALAYPTEQGPLLWEAYGGRSPLNSVAPLVCRRWRDLLRTPAAAEALFRRVCIEERSVLPVRRFDAQRLVAWFGNKAPALQELEVAFTHAVHDQRLLGDVSEAIGRVLRECTVLQALRFGGQLHLERLLTHLGPHLGRLQRLRSVVLAGGGEDWGLEAWLRELGQALPNGLQQLQIKFASEADPPEALPAMVSAFPSLRHLSLSYPIPGAVPPRADLPAELSGLTRLSTLQLKWVPAQQAPAWLGALAQLQHLYYDPYLPADAPGLPPPGLVWLTALRTLILPRRTCGPLPGTLSNLVTLHMSGPGNSLLLDWGWLSSFPKLRSLRLQSAGLREVPSAVCGLHLTRLELMVNRLADVPGGPYLKTLQLLHLGNNQLARFPPALRAAGALSTLYLANQRSPQEPHKVGAPLELAREDVNALVAMQRTLRTVIMGLNQPRIEIPPRTPAPAPGPRRRQPPAGGQRGPPPPPQAPSCRQEDLQSSQQQPTSSQQGSSGPSPFASAPQPFVACSSDATSKRPPSAAELESTADGPASAGSRGAPAREPLALRKSGPLGTVLATSPSLQQALASGHGGAEAQGPGGSGAAAAGQPAGPEPPPQTEPGAPMHGDSPGSSPLASPRMEGFDWLQRVLRRRDIKLTTDDLRYEFEQLQTVFDVPHLDLLAGH